MRSICHEKKMEKEKILFVYSIFFTLLIALVLCFVIAKNYNSLNTDVQIWIRSIELSSFVFSILTLQSFIVCYKRLKRVDVFIISLVYLIFTINLFLGFLNCFSPNYKEFYDSNFIILFTSAMRCFLLFIATCPFNKLKSYIENNKHIIVVFLILAFILAWSFSSPLDRYISAEISSFCNILFGLIYLICAFKLLYISYKDKELLFSVIAFSVFALSLKCFHGRYGLIFTDIDNTIISISLNHMSFISIIAGSFIEIYSYIINAKSLTENLSLFYNLSDNNKHSFMFICDKNGNIEYANKKLKDIFKQNYNLDTVENLNFSNLISSISLNEILNNLDSDGFWRKVIESNSETQIDCSVHLLRIHNDYDSNYYEKVAITYTDISEIVKTEIELEKLKVNNREKEDFVSNISHELRTPINIFYSTLQLLDRISFSNSSKLKPYYDKYNTILHTNCKRMLRLVNNLIDISKVEMGVLKCNSQFYNLVSIVEDVTFSVTNYAKLKNINVNFDTDCEEFITLCDSSMIERVLLNLLSNSIKFTEEYKNIYVFVKDKDDYLDIYIEDEGIGMSKNEVCHIFERFVQTDKSQKKQNEGSGIGLSIVKSLIQLHDGSISVDSTPGVGSTFKISLPKKGNYSDDCHIYDFSNPSAELELSDIY